MHIGTLNLSIPGSGAATGHQLAREVGDRLAQAQLSPGISGHLGSLSVKVTADPGAGTESLSESIVNAVIRAMGEGRRGNG